MLKIGDKTFHETPPKFAIVRHQPLGREENKQFNPDIIRMQNPRSGGVPGPTDTAEGDYIHIKANWWRYIEKINSLKGYNYTRSIGALWCNDVNWDNVTPYSTGLAESIICAGNFIAFDRETPTHVRLLSYDWNMDTNQLNPEYNNWHNQPWMFWKACAISKEGIIINVGSDLDVYFPLISEKELWMHKSTLEILPDGYDYRMYGCNVYDGHKPLLTMNDKEQIFHTNWKIETFGVIPP